MIFFNPEIQFGMLSWVGSGNMYLRLFTWSCRFLGGNGHFWPVGDDFRRLESVYFAFTLLVG